MQAIRNAESCAIEETLLGFGSFSEIMGGVIGGRADLSANEKLEILERMDDLRGEVLGKILEALKVCGCHERVRRP